MIGAQALLVTLQAILLLCRILGSALGIDVIHWAALLLLPLPFVFRERKNAETSALLSLPKKEKMRTILPCMPWIVLATVLTALLCSLLMRVVGIEVAPIEETSLWRALLSHAVVPAVLEECFFRYLPLVLLKRGKPRTLVLISSLFFALAHLSLYQIPYAFVAGVLYMLVALYTESILPCVLLHFFNNALSVLMMLYGDVAIFGILLGVLCALTLALSLIVLLRRRGEYRDALRHLFSKGEKIQVESSTVFYSIFVFLLTILFIL